MLVPNYGAPQAEILHVDRSARVVDFAARGAPFLALPSSHGDRDGLQDAPVAEVINALSALGASAAIDGKCCWIWERTEHASPSDESRERETEVESQGRSKEMLIGRLAALARTR